MIAEGVALGLPIDGSGFRLTKRIELQLAGRAYLPLIPVETEMPIERENQEPLVPSRLRGIRETFGEIPSSALHPDSEQTCEPAN